MRRLLLVAIAAAAAIAIPSSAAQACNGVGYTAVGPVYVTDDLNWIYVETTGDAELQRGDGGMVDSTAIGTSASDFACQSAGTPDSKIY